MKADRNREASAEPCGGSILVANPMAPPSPTPSHQSLPSPRTTTTSSTSTTSTTTDNHNHKTPPPPRRRGTVACRRCRRLRTKCLHGPESNPPCEACRSAGPQTASECSFPRRGEKDVDRDFRRRQPAHRLSVSSSSAASHQGTPSLNLSAPAVQPLPGGLTMPVDAPIFSPGLAAASSFGTAGHHQHQQHHQQHHHSISSSSSSFSTTSTTTPRFSSNHPTYASMSRRRQGSSVSPSSSSSSSSSPASSTSPPYFPSHEEIVAGCRSFVTSYFQLGFLPKAVFMEAITRTPGAVSPFLLSCILCISARFTPALVHKYGGSPERATDNFLRLARAMVPTEMYGPSLERAQAFFLLAIAEWGSGDRDRSSVDMGVAVRMASILKLHREESYALPPGAPAEQVIRAESARRTFWMIHSQENLHAGYSSPAPFPLEDITARLPCDEHDFAFGVSPPSTPRSVLPGTLPALLDPGLARSPDRCLFATLVQSHHLWGQVARRACRSDLKTHGTEPWEPGSEYQELTRALRRFEAEMPERHRWSAWNLRGWRAEGLHLAYLAVVMVLRVSNIVERRIYLDEILLSANSRGGSSSSIVGADTTEVSPDSKPSPSTTTGTTTPTQAPPGFWLAMSDELFAGVAELHEQIESFASLRAANSSNSNNNNNTNEGFPAILVFCVYICGSLASYLWRYPQLCPRAAARAEHISLRCLRVLGDLHRAWPTSARWHQGLRQIAAGPGPGSSSGRSESSPPTPVYSARSSGGGKHPAAAALDESIIDPRLMTSDGGAVAAKDDDGGVASFWGVGAGAGEAAVAPADADAMSNELFEAEMRNLLSEDVQFGWLDFERGGGE